MPAKLRLRRLETRLRSLLPLAAVDEKQTLMEEWLHFFQEWAKEPDLAGDANFQDDLARFRSTLELVGQRAFPPWEPPEGFLAQLPLRERRLRWRGQFDYPECHFPLMQVGLSFLGATLSSAT